MLELCGRVMYQGYVEFLSLFGSIICHSVLFGWSFMGCLCLNPAWILLAVLSYLLCLETSLIQSCLHGGKVVHLISLLYPSLKTCLKLKSQLGLLHSGLQYTFSTDNKDFFICITFLILWPNLTPCSAFSQHTSYYFCTILPRSDMSHPSWKSPILTLWKSLHIELSQQFPASISWQNVFIAAQGCTWICASSEPLRGKHAGIHLYM